MLFATIATLALPTISALAEPYFPSITLKLPHQDTEQQYMLTDGNAFYEHNLKKYGLVDSKDQLLLEPIYDNITHLSSLNYYRIEKDHKYGLVDAQGKTIFPLEFDSIDFFKKTKRFALNKNNQSGLADETGKFITPLQSVYRYAFELDDKLIATSKQTPSSYQMGIADISGNLIIPAKYEYIAQIQHHLISVRQNGKWGLIDIKDNLVLNPQYDEIEFLKYNPSLFKVKTKNTYLLINQQNQAVLSDNFTDIQELASNVFLVKNDLWRVVNQKGKSLNKTQFNTIQISNFNDDPIAVKVGDKWGFINRQGKTIIKPQFKEATKFYQDDSGTFYSTVHTESQVYDIDVNGKPYKPLIVVQ